MTIPDTINGVYEILGGLALAWNCVTTYRDKEIKGISISSMIFFTSWGYWNLYYYPSLNQWVSTIGAAILVFFNTIWVGQAIYYTRHNKKVDELKAAVEASGIFSEKKSEPVTKELRVNLKPNPNRRAENPNWRKTYDQP